jgi:pSer/pThr/pTyr-binding forkhead associated (FHA) protein
MNSANGTFVNGQRLHPQEVRVLRHGDELRLGRMVFQTLFHQSST